jgi:hypothetical protein
MLSLLCPTATLLHSHLILTDLLGYPMYIQATDLQLAMWVH